MLFLGLLCDKERKQESLRNKSFQQRDSPEPEFRQRKFNKRSELDEETRSPKHFKDL